MTATHCIPLSPAGNYEVRVRQGLPVDPVILHSGGCALAAFQGCDAITSLL